MKNKEITTLQEVSWQDVRADVKAVNPELANIIDKISLSKHCKLVKAIYSFGDLILKEGVVQLPSQNGPLSSITNLEVNSDLKSKLSYSAIPLFLILKKAAEVFIDTGTRVIPFNLFNPGNLLGLFESIDFLFNRPSSPKWSVSAGARSIFMLPKITESSGFKRLRMEYRLPSETRLQYLSDHWNVFKTIATHPSFNQAWQCEVLFFTKDWLVNSEEKSWSEFQHYLFQQSWQQAQFAINKIELSLCWESFIDAISSRNLKPTSYLADQVKHIMLVAAGKWPGFRPADDSQLSAPTKGLQQAIIETYCLKHYSPTIMHTYLLNSNDQLPVYYSLFYPTLLEGSPYNRSASTIMLDLRDIKVLIDTIKRSSHSSLKLNSSIVATTQFEYFHVEQDKYQEVKSSRLISTEDAAFLNEEQKFNGYGFCSTSSFWRGCIRISKSSEQSTF